MKIDGTLSWGFENSVAISIGIMKEEMQIQLVPQTDPTPQWDSLGHHD